MRAAIYARYSSDLQSEQSVEDQIRLCRERALKEGMTILETYCDYAISGGNLSNRPGMLALLADAKQNRFDVLLAEALDRLSRDQEDIAAIYKRLSHAGIGIVTLAEGEVNELHVGLKGTMNALFLKDLAAKTRRGQRGRVEAGKIPGGNTYGYRMVRRLKEDGSVTTGEREIDTRQAAIVRRIFCEYASGVSPRKIAAQLNAEGIPSPRGGEWMASTINGSRQRRNGILNNELYLGRITYNRQSFVKDPDTGKRRSRPNPQSEWIIKDVPHLRIVEDELWEKVCTVRRRYTSQAGNKRQTKKRLLSGLVKCGSCGGSMTIVNRERYYCSAKRERGTCKSTVGISALSLEERVLTGLMEILVGNELLLDEFAKEYRAEIIRLQKQRGDRERKYQKELNRINNAIRRCVAFVTGGDGDPGIVRDELRELEVRKREIEKTMDAEKNAQPIDLHPNIASMYTKKVAELQELLANEGSRHEAFDIIRSLIDRIEVHAGNDARAPRVVLTGALAQILSFAEGEIDPGDSGRVLMVAGAGFEPATFRL
jgi:site-specific DNA recombinase